MKYPGRNLSTDSRGEDVRLLHKELRHLGFRIPVSETRQGVFGPKTEAAVRKLQEKAGLKATGVVNRATARAISEQNGKLPPPSKSKRKQESAVVERAAESAGAFTVTGAVTSPDREVIGVLRVEIVGKQAGPDVPLAETKTDARGRYTVDFPVSKLPVEMTPPDLQARAFAGKTFLAASEIKYDAASTAVLDVAVPANTQGLPSEFESLLGAIEEHYKGKLRDLEESGERQDITWLARKCGCEARTVAMAAAADELAAESSLHSAFYYALLSAGLSADPGSLYQTDLATASGIWKTAIAQGLIPQNLEDKRAEAEKAFQKLASDRVLGSRPVAGTSSLKEVVELTLQDEKQQQKFADLYARHRNDLPKLWDEARKEFGGEAAERLRLDGQLSLLTLNNAPLIKALRGKVSSPEDLVKDGFYRAEAWKALVAKSPIPDDIPGGSEEERRANYAESLAAQVRKSFPDAVVAEKVRKSEAKPAMARKQLAHSVAPAMDTASPTTPEADRVRRVLQITPDDKAMEALLAGGLDSSYKIVTTYEEEEFVRLFKDQLGGEVKARQIHARARQVHNTVLNVAVSYLLARNAPGLGMTPDASAVLPTPAPGASDVLAYPTLENLFGSMDYCACEHCKSVLSPSAYLVDLLQFLDHPKELDKNPQKILLDRRPDLQHLPLTCENTNTPVPYIDLVNEVLEYFVTHNLSLTGYSGYDTGGNVSPEELLANPQFVNETAYNTLRAGIFPAPLPYHKPLEALRRYFDKLEVPLHEAMAAFAGEPAVGYGTLDTLMERLKLSRGQYNLLINRTWTFPQIYGYPSEADALRELVKAKVFARRVGISYEEVVELLETQLLRRLGPITLTIPAGGVQPSSFEAYEFRVGTNPPRPIHYVALLRFLRLGKMLGLTIGQTDQLTSVLASDLAFSGNDPADLELLDRGLWVLLQRTGIAFQVLQRLKLTPGRDLAGLLACWSPLTPGGTGAAQEWLARNLRLSVAELRSLMRFTGLDPFAMPNPTNNPTVRLLDFLDALAAGGLKPVQALYLIWNEDLSGKSVPDDRLITDLARTLRSGFAAIESDLALASDPAGKLARKQQQALTAASAALRIDLALTQAILTDREALHAVSDTAKPAIADLLALESTTTSAGIDQLRSTVIRLLKVAALASALKLTVREVLHFATRTEYRIGGKGWLNALTDGGRQSVTWELRDVLMALLIFARLKSELSPGDERLLAVLQNPDAVLADGRSLLLSLTGWDRASLDVLLPRFGLTTASLARVEPFRRVRDACAVAKKVGVPASVLVNVVTNEPTQDSVRALQAALRSRYDETGWLAFIRPINDELRGLGRDALVAYILHKLAEKPDTRHIDTPDKLFEYFLMDVEMEPCMQTTRVRHALSSAQLFIERCLMNLETRVTPSLIPARQWEWMKRYRLWEANRKVFLWPENWLEPELRDDQSPFFKESMSELLQGDITDDTAAAALLDYLSKLDEIAKLEPCDVYYVEGQPGKGNDVAHVVARSTGANRKYYYRRREGGSWTPWEQIKLDVEGNPVRLVVWQGRLFLFWFKFLRKGPQQVNTPRSGTWPPPSLTALTTGDVGAMNPTTIAEIVLCWSEYYNGKWQPARTSDPERPVPLGTFWGTVPDRLWFRLDHTADAKTLRILIGTRELRFNNTHGLPQELAQTYTYPTTGKWRSVYVNSCGSPSTLSIQCGTYEPPHNYDHREILRVAALPRLVDSANHLEPHRNLWFAPFFFENSHHLFYVTTAEKPASSSFGASAQAAQAMMAELPAPMAAAGGPERQQLSAPPDDSSAGTPSRFARFLSEDAYFRPAAGAGAISRQQPPQR